MFQRVFVFLALAVAAHALMTPYWEPETFEDCFVTRQQVIDEMIETFDLDNDGRADMQLVYCIWDNTTVISDFFKTQMPDGVDAISWYCDGDGDGYLTRDEVEATKTCVGNCATANSLHTFRTQVVNNESWIPVCGQYA
jgi:hypothetical protein